LWSLSRSAFGWLRPCGTRCIRKKSFIVFERRGAPFFPQGMAGSSPFLGFRTHLPFLNPLFFICSCHPGDPFLFAALSKAPLFLGSPDYFALLFLLPPFFPWASEPTPALKTARLFSPSHPPPPSLPPFLAPPPPPPPPSEKI